MKLLTKLIVHEVNNVHYNTVCVCVCVCVHVCQKVFVLIIMYFNSIV